MTARVVPLHPHGPAGNHDTDAIRQRRRPWHFALGGLIVVLVVGVEAFLLQSYRETERTTAGFSEASTVTTFLANIQREAILLQAEAERLDRTQDLDALRLRRMILARQLTVARSYIDPTISKTVAAIDALVDRFDDAVAALGDQPSSKLIRRGTAALVDPLRDLELEVKRLYDEEDIAFNDITLRTLRARAANQKLLLAMGAVIMIMGAGLALSLRHRVRRDFERAYVALQREFDERRAAEEALRASEERFRSMIQNSSDVVTIVDARGTITYQTPAVERVLGSSPDEHIRKPMWSLIHPDDRSRAVAFLDEWADRPGMTSATEWRMRHRDGSWRNCEAVGTNLLHDPNVQGFVLNMRDVSERRALEEKLAHRAFHDPLTELANRAMFQDRVEHALVAGARTQQEIAVLFLDLDDFKRINDSMGHAAGDELLLAVAARIRSCLRPSDTAARLGGDEFAILLESAGEDEAVAVAERIIQTLDSSVELHGRKVYARASVGIVVGIAGTHTVQELLRDADVAMYSVKSDGKGRYQVFRPHLHAAALNRLELEADLKAAVDAGEFVIHLQPIVRLDDGKAVGFEALVRWQHPTRGLLPPSEFIAAAEETGLIVPIGRQVLAQAADAMRGSQFRHPEFAGLTVSVNLSARQLQDPHLVEDIKEILEESGLPAQSLVLEITESILMDKLDVSAARLAQLKLLGIQIAIDDFGSGYSSLTYLKQLPVDLLKIDRSFVAGVGNAMEDTTFMRALHRLAKTLNLRTVVEGVETQRQLTSLQKIGFQMAQGFLFARPMALDELQRYTDEDVLFPEHRLELQRRTA